MRSVVQVYLGPLIIRGLRRAKNFGGGGGRARLVSEAVTAFRSGAVAQLGERQLCKLDVIGSIPISSTVFAL